MKNIKLLYLFVMLLSVMGLASCSENDDTEEEYPNWQVTNTKYFSNLKDSVSKLVAAGDTAEWNIYKIWSQTDYKAGDKSDSVIIVHKLKNGTGSGCPIYTDSVRVHYGGKLLPSTSYPSGYKFAQSYSTSLSDYDVTTCIPAKLAVSGVIDGFSTALQRMHIGDRWIVYMPYQLGYGTSGSTSIPGYSVLIYDMQLAAYYRAGQIVPSWK